MKSTLVAVGLVISLVTLTGSINAGVGPMFVSAGVDTTADTLAYASLVHGSLDASPVPLEPGRYSFDIAIYTDSSGGERLWEGQQTVIVEHGGVFYAILEGFSAEILLDTTETPTLVTRYLELSLPQYEKTYGRVPMVSRKNALAATVIPAFRLNQPYQPPDTTSAETDTEALPTKISMIQSRLQRQVLLNLTTELKSLREKLSMLEKQLQEESMTEGK